MFRTGLAAALVLLQSAAAFADTHTFRAPAVAAGSRFVHPALVVGFNPQPDPPGIDGQVRIEEGRPVLATVARRGNVFGLTIGMKDATGAYRIAFRAPRDAADITELRFTATASDGRSYLIVVDVASFGGFVDPGSIRGFNPQPEPPGDAIGVQFAILSDRAAIPASASIAVYDAAGEVALD